MRTICADLAIPGPPRLIRRSSYVRGLKEHRALIAEFASQSGEPSVPNSEAVEIANGEGVQNSRLLKN